MSDLRALSITRPWSTLILHHGKDIENRSWSTHYRGPLLVAGALSWQGSAVGYAEELGIVGVPWERGAHPTGIVGVVDLVSVCTAVTREIRFPETSGCDCGRWAAAGQYHWHLANPRPLAEPVPHPGRLGLWEPSLEALAAVAAQGVLHVG